MLTYSQILFALVISILPAFFAFRLGAALDN